MATQGSTALDTIIAAELGPEQTQGVGTRGFRDSRAQWHDLLGDRFEDTA